LQNQVSGQVELSLVEVFRKFFSLLGLASAQLKGEEEGLYDLLELARKKFENSDKSEREVFRWLFRRWQKYFPDEAAWREGYIVLRALFVEEMKWDEISFLTGRHVSELRMVALKSLVAQTEFTGLEDRPSRDCARNDIYLLDFLSRQNWADPLTLNSDKGLESHIKNCPRCSEMVQKSRAWIDDICEESKRDLNLSILESLVEGRESVGSTSELLVKSFLGVAAMVAIVLLVPYVPSFTKFVGAGIQNVASKVQLNKSDVDDIEKVLDEVAEKEDRGFSLLDKNPTDELVSSNKNEEPRVVEAHADKITDPTKREKLKKNETVTKGLDLKPSEERQIFAFNYVVLPEDMIEGAEVEERSGENLSSEASSVLLSKKKPEAKKPFTELNESQKSLDPEKSSKSQDLAESKGATSQVFFRWGARAQDPERLKTKVLEILGAYSAENISELGLGSLYKGGQYFHFTMNKSDYSKLLNGIRELPFTEFTVSEATGSRKIDASLSRIVFWVGPSK